MYIILSSTLTKGIKSKLYGQKHISFEIVAHDGLINYYAIVPAVLTETMKHAITAAYPLARRAQRHPYPLCAARLMKAGQENRCNEYRIYVTARKADAKRTIFWEGLYTDLAI